MLINQHALIQRALVHTCPQVVGANKLAAAHRYGDAGNLTASAGLMTGTTSMNTAVAAASGMVSTDSTLALARADAAAQEVR